MKERLFVTGFVAAVLVAVESAAEFPGTLSSICWVAMMFLGPIDAVVAGVVGGLHRHLPSPLELVVVAYISVISLSLSIWLMADQLSEQAMTNSVVAMAGLVLFAPVACVLLGLGGYLVVRLGSASPVRDEPGGRAAR